MYTLCSCCRVLEGVLIAIVTTCVAFFCPIYLGRCKPLSDLQVNVSVQQETKQYFCAEGHYNDMASLFFNSQETAIKQLFHNDGMCYSSFYVLVLALCFYLYLFSCFVKLDSPYKNII